MSEQIRKDSSMPNTYRSLDDVVAAPSLPNPCETSDSQALHRGSHGNDPSAVRASHSRRPHVRRFCDESYDVPEDFSGLNEFAAPSPVDTRQEEPDAHHGYLGNVPSRDRCSKKERNTASEERYTTPDDFSGPNEVAAPSPIDNPLENIQSRDRPYEGDVEVEYSYQEAGQNDDDRSSSSKTKANLSWHERASQFATLLYTVSYLILFSILGTLARLGLQALTLYPGSPVAFSELWANVGGSVIMGYLSEDTSLFSDSKWGKTDESDPEKRDADTGDEPVVDGTPENKPHGAIDTEAEGANPPPKPHIAVKKVIPLYIGLTTGFCGSFTSFSSFIRDIFLALSNQLAVVPNASPSPLAISPRNGGYSFMSLLAVIILIVSLCLSALKAGAHLAIALAKGHSYPSGCFYVPDS